MHTSDYTGIDDFGQDPTMGLYGDPQPDPYDPEDPVLGRWINGVWVWITTPVTLQG
jgi:hypothetical protein